MIPYDPPLITKLLRAMPDAKLAAVTPTTFQTQPVEVVIPAQTIRELIDNERARRRRK